MNISVQQQNALFGQHQAFNNALVAAQQQNLGAVHSFGLLTSGLYGGEYYNVAYRQTFPRSEEAQVQRMNRFVMWKREKIRERNVIRAMWIGGWLFVPPVVITVLAFLYRMAIGALLG